VNGIGFEHPMDRYGISQVSYGLSLRLEIVNLPRRIGIKHQLSPRTSSVHFGTSANASSTVQPLLIMTPDHDPGVFTLSCPLGRDWRRKEMPTALSKRVSSSSCPVFSANHLRLRNLA